jgi:hypothetical protein
MKKTPVIAAILFLFMSASIHAQNNIQDNIISGNVTRASFTTAIEDREPVDDVGQLANNVPRVFFFTEITGMANQTVTHRWQHDGEIKAKTRLKIGGNRWRVWSSKKLLPQWTGIWTVTVLDAEGNTLAEADMVYIPVDSTR